MILKLPDSLHVSDEVPAEDMKDDFLNFIEVLNLQHRFPQKLQLIDGLMIQWDLLHNNRFPCELHRLPYLILQKVMMYYDYRPLSKQMAENTNFKIHPIDVFLALLHCCDNILRQDLLSRLIRCQLAIPFLLPNPINKTTTLLLWAMRSTVCEWKCKIGASITSKESCIVDYKAPIILFLRIGVASSPKEFSKSHMLNTVIGDQNYFFHWNCPGGNFNRKFMNGLVELSCYLPSGTERDSFSDAVYFLNLRGDARYHNKQLGFLTKITFMSFAVLLEEILDDTVFNLMRELATLPGGLVMIFPNFDHVCKLQNFNRLQHIISGNKITPLNIKGENEDSIKSEIQKHISCKISTADISNFISLSECAVFASECGIKVDEDNQECKEGHKLANHIVKVLDSVSATDAKGLLLPLQGPELWHKWANHDKESFQALNKGNVTVAYYNDTIEQKKKEIRMIQYEKVTNPSALIKHFIDSLQNSSALVRTYFLQWLKLFLDNRSRKILPSMRTEYERIRAELFKMKKSDKVDINSAARNLANRLKKQNKELIDGSLGIEHFFRELGQIYEAVTSHGSSQSNIECYPKIMVNILNQGYPVEIMDGDASHVPITWVLAILDQLKEQHKGKKVSVISVVGIQSTGKSTLLNTMFGLQFNVSAGRCTRGAFMQLLPIKNNVALCKGSTCDFVLIIDTEGLRAPELSSTESPLHDNQLATFVIGLADVAIINIYGETPGDLNDILQTAVHAFIRMKNVSMDLSCHFVHQNVTALLVDSKIKFGQQSFQDKLNEMTMCAAKAEHCESKYSSFQDIIKFDGKADTTYFPGLWKGDPPMAPVNPGYCEKALNLKISLMTLVDKKETDSSITNFKLRVNRLWYAVCSENYIFSFKSTQEVTAYNHLDAEFSQWSWTLHRKMLEWKFETGNCISSCPTDQVSSVVMECLKKAESMLTETYTKLAEQMTEFFENSEQAATLAQWKSRYQIRLQHLKDDSKKEAKKQCDLFKLNREGRLKLEKIHKHHRQQLLKHIEELVANAKQNNTTLTQKELQKKFDEKWQLWMSEFSNEEYQSMYASNEEIEVIICDVLQDLLNRHHSILTPKLKDFKLLAKENCELKIVIDPCKHLSNGNQVDNSAGFLTKVFAYFGLSEDTNIDIISKIQIDSDSLFIKGKMQ